MNVYDRMEEAGHDLTLVVGLSLGVSTYVCEHCGALIKLKDGAVLLFHVARASATSREDQCYPGGPAPADHQPLRDKLRKIEEQDMEELRRRMDDD